MFQWYRRRKVVKTFNDASSTVIGPDNYKLIGELLKFIDIDELEVTLPQSLRNVIIPVNTNNAIQLHGSLVKYKSHLERGVSFKHNNPKGQYSIDEYFIDPSGYPIKVNATIKEIVKQYGYIETLLDTVAQKNVLDLEYYLNCLSPVLKDLVTITKLFMK